jgi:hypothetical protein
MLMRIRNVEVPARIEHYVRAGVTQQAMTKVVKEDLKKFHPSFPYSITAI